MPTPSELLSLSLKEAAGVDRKRLAELGRIIDSLYAPTSPAVSVFPGGGSLLMTPGTLSVNSANNPDGRHTHAITSSSNPGASASILATDVSGALTLRSLNIGAAVGAVPGEVRASVGFAARTDDAGGGFFAGAASDVQWRWFNTGVWYTPDNVFQQGNLGVGLAGAVYFRTSTDRAHVFLDDVATFLQEGTDVTGKAVVSNNAWFDQVVGYKRLIARNTASALKLESDGSLGFYVATDAGSTFDSVITFTKRAAVSTFIDSLTDGNTGGFRAGAASDVLWYRDAVKWRTPNYVTVDQGVNVGAATSAVTGQVHGAGTLAGWFEWAATNTSASAAASTAYSAYNDVLAGAHLLMLSSAYTTSGVLVANRGGLYTDGSAGLFIVADNASGNIYFAAGGVTEKMRLTAAGQLQVPTAGSGAGILAGSSVQWYEGDTNMWRTPDGVKIDVGLALADAISATAGEIQSTASDVGSLVWKLRNTNGGITASTLITAWNDSAYEVGLQALSSTFTASGVRVANAVGIFADAPSLYIENQRPFSYITFAAGSSAEKMRLTDAGLLQLPTTGAGAGVVLGTTTQLYESASNMLRTPDGLTVDLGLNIGSASGAATGEARASVGFAARVDGNGGGFRAGAASDVQLYRDIGPRWRTPQAVTVDGNLVVSGLDPNFNNSAVRFLLGAPDGTNSALRFVVNAGGIEYIQAGASTTDTGAELHFARYSTATSKISKVVFYANNIGINTGTFGTGADGVLGIANVVTAPTSSPADMIQVYSKDSSVGAVNATLAIRTEQGVEAIGTFTPSHKLRVWINETEYWLQLDAV